MRMIPKSLFQTKGWINGHMPSNLINKTTKFGTVAPIKPIDDEEMDDSTCHDLVSDSRAEYENSQIASASGEPSYEFGIR